ncbi:FimV/HubP family polar landmark protein [Marinimicrobium sp. ARAG 43.8]|uniref:FimV/HubP family polar landmark protein n=1 Tax=Marinimicrobium sp. ARAG 43.8 TaxID=3418719 RepID=UPI003CEC7A0A
MHLLRQLVFVLGLATLLVSQPGFALGLGNSELHSALNQPFRADIQLTNLRDLSGDEIIVRLASTADFQRAGIERLEFYNQLQFEVQLDAPGGPLVRVTSREPVREPYMNFLVEARWASGRLLREYTFLLDLPTFDDEQQTSPVQAVSPGEAQQRSSGRRATSSQDPASQPSRTESGGTRSSGGSDTYRVNANDTLWEIALRARPDRDLSVQQTMLAIQRENPEAFINGNINLLREGQVLRLPDRDQILRENRQGAVREVAQQNREWSGGTLGAQLDAGQRSGSAPRESSGMSGQVRLAAPTQNGSGESGQSGGQSTDSGAEVEAELAGAREELDKSRRENRELASRVEELEAQIETMESLIEASNEQLRALQATARQNQDAEEPSRDDSADTQASAENTGNVSSEGDSQADPQVDAEVGAEVDSAEVATSSDDRGKRVVRSAPKPKTLVDHVMDNLLWVGLGVLGLLIVILLAVRRRQSSPSNDGSNGHFEDTDTDEPLDPAFTEDDYAAFQAEQETMEVGEDRLDDASEKDDTSDMAPDDWNEAIEEPEVEAETGDVVGEADIYIAYGKLDQAEELLLKALDKEPDSPAIRSKLLEIYAENRDVRSFDHHYAALLETGDRDAIQRASELRETIPGAGEFDVSALEPSGEPESAAVTLTHDEERSEAGEDSEFDLGLDDDFEFDLDEEPKSEASITDDGAVKASAEGDDFSFDEIDGDIDGDLDFTLDESDDNAVTLTERDRAEGDRAEGDRTEEDRTEEDRTEEESDDFPELDLKLDEGDFALSDSADQRSAQSPEASELDDWEFDFETDAADGDRLEALDDELSLLDDSPEASDEPKAQADTSDLGFSLEEDAEDELTLSDTDFDSAATTEDEQAAASEGLADLDDEEAFTEDWSASQSDREPESGLEPEAETRLEQELPAEEEATSPEAEDDLDLDSLDMGDMDLSSLDEEMSDLDADLENRDEQEAEPPAVEDDLSVQGGDSSDDILPEDYTQSEADLIDDEDMDAELDFLADADEAATKLDLARAYIDMGDTDGARDILEEVREEGNEDQRKEADELLGRIIT